MKKEVINEIIEKYKNELDVMTDSEIKDEWLKVTSMFKKGVLWERK